MDGKRILIFSAHPDDAEIGMGGTIAMMADRGDKIASLVFTDGRRSATATGIGGENLAGVREVEAKEASAILGGPEPRFCRLSDLTSPENSATAAESVRRFILEDSPREIYIPHPELDRHPTHRLAGQTVLQVIASLNLPDCAVWAYEVWGLFSSWDRLEDITAQIGRKLLAIDCHRSQVALFPYGEAVVGLNRWRAVFADPHQKALRLAYAEVFIRIC